MPHHESFDSELNASEQLTQPAETILGPEEAERLQRAALAIGETSLRGVDNEAAEKQGNVHEINVDSTSRLELANAGFEAAAHIAEKQQQTKVAA